MCSSANPPKKGRKEAPLPVVGLVFFLSELPALPAPFPETLLPHTGCPPWAYHLILFPLPSPSLLIIPSMCSPTLHPLSHICWPTFYWYSSPLLWFSHAFYGLMLSPSASYKVSDVEKLLVIQEKQRKLHLPM